MRREISGLFPRLSPGSTVSTWSNRPIRSLPKIESGRPARLAHVTGSVEQMLEGKEDAVEWLNTVVPVLSSRKPLFLLGMDGGASRTNDRTGADAGRLGGRFNRANRGIFVVYAFAQVSLTVLETLVHIGLKARAAAANRYLVETSVPQQVFSARQIMAMTDLYSAGHQC